MYERNKQPNLTYEENLLFQTRLPKEKLSEILNLLSDISTDTLLPTGKTLYACEKDMIVRFYKNDETLIAIAPSYGVTRERIRQRINYGLSKIRRTLS